MLIKVIDGVAQEYSIEQLRIDNPQTSFPDVLPAKTLAEYDVFEVIDSQAPEYNPLSEKLVPVEPKKIKGKWTRKFEVQKIPSGIAKKQIQEARSQAFREEADPMFFRAQRGEIEMDEYLAKVEEIRTRFAYPEEIAQ